MGQAWELHEAASRISFPFEGPVSSELKNAFVDALVIDTNRREEKIVLDALSAAAGSASLSAFYEDTLDNFFTGVPSSIVQVFGTWIFIQFYDALSGNILSLLLDGRHVSLPFSFLDMGAVFTARCVDRAAPGVKTLRVKDYLDVVHTISGQAVFSAGYNMEILTEDQDELFAGFSRTGTPLQFNAISGAGLGRVPNSCEGDGLLRTINGVGPDEQGHFRLDARDCYNIWVPGTAAGVKFAPEAHTLQLQNTCLPCCSCDDYGRVYKALNRLYQVGHNIGKSFERTNERLQDLNDLIYYHRQQRAKRRMQLFLRPAPGYIVGVQIVFINNPIAQDIELVDHSVNLELSAGDPEAVDSDHCVVIPDACFIFNEQYENWRRLRRQDVFPTYDVSPPPDLVIRPNDPDLDLTEQYFDHVKGCQYASIYFEIDFFPEGTESLATPPPDYLVDEYPITFRLFDSADYWYAPDDTHEIEQAVKLRAKVRSEA